jgi:sRNA-binding regulator protein Hfq
MLIILIIHGKHLNEKVNQIERFIITLTKQTMMDYKHID